MFNPQKPDAMKTLMYFTMTMIAVFILLFNSCEKDSSDTPPPPPPPSDPPEASFSMQGSTAVVNEPFYFESTCSGVIISYSWDFGDGEGSSSSKNPVYTFKTLGSKTVSLTVIGPGGSDTYSDHVTVYAMPPECHK